MEMNKRVVAPENKNSHDIKLYLESHNYYMDENWDGEGKYISGKLMGVLKDSIIDFKRNELVEKMEI